MIRKAKNAPKDSDLYKLMSIDNEVPETGDTFHEYIKSSQYMNVEDEAILNLLNKDIFKLLSDKEKTITTYENERKNYI
ncbi:hypothetical protein BAOM_2938 [Peribacillus asahii]|uniref:Uncharacterized protein n=1 Tax=Peribacillus asahii TaxID=228899 RepID=A0A3Q9RK36_9BACI|nr:hypothetical protein [Peribacillus asahii]AZV43547.1 hypothetical protein BAOM_2938 [Peribacillus asahii]